MSGLVAAHTLQEKGLAVEVFEKSKSYGGRLATRRAFGGRFDHGAPFISAHSIEFQKQCEQWVQEGYLQPVGTPWQGASLAAKQKHYVAISKMKAPLTPYLERISLLTQTRVQKLCLEEAAWWLACETGEKKGPFAAVLLAIPSPQIPPLLKDLTGMAGLLSRLPQMEAVWAFLFGFSKPLGLSSVAGAWTKGPFSFYTLARARLPSTPERDYLVVHSHPSFAKDHLTDSAEMMIQQWGERCLAALEITGPPSYQAAHLWRYAHSLAPPLKQGFFWDQALRIGCSGDWAGGGGVEGAYWSGLKLAQKVMGGIGEWP